ncbi:NapH/MauN family ferredoxin-type protein [Thiohalomonas denitrificans]|uniref:NapH/MauN family ferredoxin-type protein n=1 Tax=Thiohalomonas denitrificans TaxID=415747 RepID=UPI0026F33ACC|nr:NapH/MauN family ferredoxin-type protein [Thiohalomonas denitrificans]
MNLLFESFAQLIGRAPRKPTKEEIKPAAQKIHFYKRGEKLDREEARALHAAHKSNKWRNRRWVTLIAINLLFVVSYKLDIQLLEGALTASRFLGFHMADLNSSLQVTLAFKEILLNLVIGTVTILLLWLLLGGRTFCSWVCPYHLVAELAEKIHVKLVDSKIIKGYDFHRGVRTFLYILFALLALVTSYTVFEFFSPTGILSRALIYGPGLALVWVGALLLFEVFVSRRAWCRYVCPIGMTYGLVGLFSPMRLVYDLDGCQHEGECRKVCEVPHVLEPVIKGRATDRSVPIGADCTRCGLCIDTCPTGSLRFEVKGLSKLL